jgi:16S rRNA (guanine966-N2)-methyltransferase
MARALRVISGIAGGLHLVAPKGSRPTTDRAKEALFASLGRVVEGANVLDLFAGSGALGLEALSRGARRATFVDDDRAAVTAIRRNLATTGLAERSERGIDPARATVLHKTVRGLLAPSVVVGGAGGPFDLVFVDPPYELDATVLAGLLERLETGGWLEPGATVVVERRTGDPVPLPPGWQVTSRRTSGDTLLVVATV